MLRLALVATFTLTVGGAAAMQATVIYAGQTTTLDTTLDDPTDLWVSQTDLTRSSGFELKLEGLCLGPVCVPVQEGGGGLTVARDGETWVNLTELARKLNQAHTADLEHRVFSFAEVPQAISGQFASAAAPDFELTDRQGNTVRLSDYRGKKVVLFTWASWCGCRFDLPGWQKLHEELNDKNLQIISVAEDTGGEAAAGEFFDRANASYTQIIDENHVISMLYNMVNVPTGVWIDEQGKMVRPPEVAYSDDVSLTIGGKTIAVEGTKYAAAIRDWVENGADSEYAMTPEEISGRLTPRTDEQAFAEANFQLGVHFHKQGNAELADKYWAEAQRLRPDSWNYHRQDWAFTPDQANRNWFQKFMALGDKPYYEPLKLD